MGLENVLAGDGFALALVGMGVVVAGLVLVSLFVTVLPRLLVWIDRRVAGGGGTGGGAGPGGDGAATVREPPVVSGMPPDLLVAIGYVIQAERERMIAGDHQRITQRDQDEQRVWTAIGKMRTLSNRM